MTLLTPREAIGIPQIEYKMGAADEPPTITIPPPNCDNPGGRVSSFGATPRLP
jgi:hypothetical protein